MYFWMSSWLTIASPYETVTCRWCTVLVGHKVYMGLPVNQLESTIDALTNHSPLQAYALSKPGEESAEFKEMESRRANPKPETAEEALKRSGVRSYADAIASGVDVCDTTKGIGCGRRGK